MCKFLSFSLKMIFKNLFCGVGSLSQGWSACLSSSRLWLWSPTLKREITSQKVLQRKPDLRARRWHDRIDNLVMSANPL